MTGRLRRVLPAVALVATPAVALLGTPAPAVAADTACAVDRIPGSDRLADLPVDAENPALDRMGVAAAQDLATGRGVKIAVVDSGIMPGVGGIDRRPLWELPGSAAVLSAHGTIAAAHIAGDHGAAPAATVYDVRVFDSDDADTTQGQKPLTSAGLAAGIRAVVDAQPREQFDIVNISLMVGADDPVLAQAVAELVALDVLVVAAAGNLGPAAAGAKGTPGSDAEVFPADYDGVVAVSAVPPVGSNPRAFVLPNLDTDVAAPTLGSISYNANGQRCAQVEVATSWAAAEVSGVLALLRERFPQETPAQLVARLTGTTEGAGAQADAPAVRDPWVGAGVVQAYDALTRELEPGREGRIQAVPVDAGADGQAAPPRPRLDLFGSSRALLLWWTLAAGVLLALAFMLRPLLAQRRDE